MRNSIKTLITLVVLLCSSIAFGQNTTSKDTLTVREITVKKCRKFTLNFTAYESAGYNWSVSNYDTTKIKLISVTKKLKEGSYPVGGPMVQDWKFKARKKGDYTLVFIYKRPFEQKIEKTEKINIHVK